MDERPEAWSPRVKTVRAGSLSMGSTSEEGEFQQGWGGETLQGSLKSYLPSCSWRPTTPIASAVGRQLEVGVASLGKGP